MPDHPATSDDQPRPLRLRSDLRITAGEDGGFVIEDPSRGQFFRVGPSEYSILAQLDGRTTLTDAARRAIDNGGAEPLAAANLHALGQWLTSVGLVESPGSAGPANPPTPGSPAKPGFDPCYIRISLGSPVRLLVPLVRWFGWLFSAPAIVVVVLLSIAALVYAAWHWAEFSSPLGRVLCPDQHLALLVSWLVLKLVHELGHGIACQRLGGKVREWGVALTFFVPVAYTDVTSSWRFGSRWERMAVAAAGMYAEWLLALVALAVWSSSGSPAVRQLCVYIISLATLTTILFNANPLCRLDGYYLLSDLLAWPNLAADGQRVWRGWLSRLTTGEAPPASELPPERYWPIGFYGLAATLWRLATIVTMAVVAFLAYEGLGILMIATIAVIWWQRASRGRKHTANSHPRKNVSARSIGIRLAVVAAAVSLMWLPWPGATTAPGLVEHERRHSIHAPCAAFLQSLSVEDGQWVASGQELAVLENDDLLLELSELESACEQSGQKQRSLRTRRQLVDLQVEEQRQTALRQQIEDCRRKLAELTLRAPIAGRIVARRLGDRRGTFLAEGAELCSIVESPREFQVAIAQADLATFANSVGKPVEVCLPGQQFPGVLARLAPQASTNLELTLLGAGVGGPLAVVPTDTKESGTNPPSGWQLHEPRVVGHIQFASEPPRLLAGQRGYVSLRPLNETIVARLSRFVGAWFRRVQKRAKG